MIPVFFTFTFGWVETLLPAMYCLLFNIYLWLHHMMMIAGFVSYICSVLQTNVFCCFKLDEFVVHVLNTLYNDEYGGRREKEKEELSRRSCLSFVFHIYIYESDTNGIRCFLHTSPQHSRCHYFSPLTINFVNKSFNNEYNSSLVCENWSIHFWTKLQKMWKGKIDLIYWNGRDHFCFLFLFVVIK